MPYVWKSPYIEHVSFAVLDEDNSALSRKITELVKTNNYVDVNYYPSSEDELEKAIKKGKVYGGLIIPKDFSKDVALKKTPDMPSWQSATTCRFLRTNWPVPARNTMSCRSPARRAHRYGSRSCPHFFPGRRP